MSNEEASIAAPMFVTWYQCVVTAAICVVLGYLGEKTRKTGQGSFLDEFPLISFDLETSLSVMSLSLIFVGMIAFNNLCLQLVEVSFYNVARSLTIVFNVIFTYFVLGKTTSMVTCATLVVVFIGFYVGIDGEVNFSLVGTVAGVFSSLFVALNSIYTSKVLPKVRNDKSLLLFYNNINGCVLFIPLILYYELPVIVLAISIFAMLLRQLY